MGATNCCGSYKENMFEAYLIGAIKTTKLNQLKFENLYQILTDKKFPDSTSNDIVEETVSASKVKAFLNEYLSNDKNEFKDIFVAFSDKIFKRFCKRGEDNIPIQNIMLRLMPFVSDDNHNKVYYFFACSNNSFTIDGKGLILTDSVNYIVEKYLKYNLIQLTTDFIDILSTKDIFKKMIDDVNKVKEYYKESNVSDYVNGVFKFENKYETLEIIVRTIKNNNSIFEIAEMRANFLIHFMFKEREATMKSAKN